MKKLKFPLIIGLALISGIALSFANTNKTDNAIDSDESQGSEVIYLDKTTFKEKVFDYEASQTWDYKGEVPAILDFYADWCGPCKQLSPVLKQLQKEYGDKIQIYKINTDKEKELAGTFGIRSLPTIVFVPLDGEPQAAMGFRPKNDMETMIKEILKVEK
ncbi:thioredoxin [Carboxylicivirga sp. N1Y90]|uniref:thioredoxin n=1 Tax=Carboxylicivirga fragile TaxID=3417571 RepID=UPI003D359139|nr:thioredoxin [Marinilabiliaceae bacterium N1Y90]